MITGEIDQGEVLSIYSEKLEENETRKTSKNEDILNIIFLITMYIIQGINILFIYILIGKFNFDFVKLFRLVSHLAFLLF